MPVNPQAVPKNLPPHAVASERRMMACHVRVRTLTGATYSYYALATSTCDAVIQAMGHFGHCKVSASAVYPSQSGNVAGGNHV